MWNPFKKHSYTFLPKFTKLTSLASTNLFVLAIRLVQIFFEGVVLGVIADYISIQLSEGLSASSPYVFTVVVSCFSILTQFAYCFSYQHKLFFMWDAVIAVFWIMSFFWLLNMVGDYLSCGWSSFNPFGADRCSQTRSVLIIQIVLTILWAITSAIQGFDVWRGKRIIAAKIEV